MAVNPQDIARRAEEVRTRIAQAARRSGRDPDDVTLVAVSKTFPAPDIRAAIEAADLRHFGENRAQELREKVTVLGTEPRWHFIGNLQTNKVRHVVGVELIHSVDRSGLAEAIAKRAVSTGQEQAVLIEVNVSGEDSKGGIEPTSVGRLAEQIADLDGIVLRGLMAMAPFSSDPESSRPVFKELRDLGELLRRDHPRAVELSMGMTQDLEVAVEEGATIVRVGRAIFGPRS